MTSSGDEIRERRIALDTSAYSQLRRGDSRLIDAIANAEAVLVPMTVIGELEAGFRLGHRQRENRKALDTFLRQPFVSAADITRDVAERFGEVFAQLRRDGRPIPVNDIWIGAFALVHDAHLVTFDSDFASIERLRHTRLLTAP